MKAYTVRLGPGHGWAASAFPGFGAMGSEPRLGFPPVGMFSDALVMEYFEGKDAFWDTFVTPAPKLSRPPGMHQGPGAANERDVCVRVCLLQGRLSAEQRVFILRVKKDVLTNPT